MHSMYSCASVTMYTKLLLIVVFQCFIFSGFGCKIKGYVALSMEERLEKFDIIVYGKDLKHVTRNGEYMDFTDSLFEVYCVIKGDRNMTSNITIEEIFPKTACSGTYMFYLDKLKGKFGPGLEIILGLERNENGNYFWQEVNDMESSAFEPTLENWNTVEKVMPFKDWISSDSSEYGCPLRLHKQPAEGTPKPEGTPESETESTFETGSQTPANKPKDESQKPVKASETRSQGSDGNRACRYSLTDITLFGMLLFNLFAR